ARGAAGLFAKFLAASHPDYQLQPMFWRFDQLDSSHWGEMALRDATRAAAIVIALSDNSPMHAAAESWLTSLATLHQGTSVRVTALLNEEPWTISLEQAGPARAVKASGATLFSLPGK